MPESATAIEIEAAALTARILQATRLVSEDMSLHGHTTWEVCEMLKILRPSKFTPVEMMAVAVVLAGVHMRDLQPPPTLRLCAEPWEGVQEGAA